MDISANASAEANFIKDFSFSPELTFNWQKGKSDKRSAFPMRMLEGTSRALNPAKYENKLADARLIHTKSICECYSLYKRTMPSLTDNQAFLLANGYTLTPGEADNITSVLSEASDRCPQADPDKLDVQFKDSFIKGGATAYDDEVRRIWADLLNSEFQQPGSFSKKTLHMLKSMDRNDVKAFSTLCSLSVLTPNGKRPSPVLKAINGEGWSYDNESITVDQLGMLAAIGLIDKNTWTTYTLQPHSAQKFIGGNQCFYAKNRTEHSISFGFGNAMFLSPGIELASLCEIGNANNLQELVKEAVTDSGLDIETTFDPNEPF